MSGTVVVSGGLGAVQPANVIPYTPATPSDWGPIPGNVAAALDELGVIGRGSRVLRVIPGSAPALLADQNGSIDRPYAKIQDAITAATAATTAAQMRLGPWVVLVQGGTYDEDLSWDQTALQLDIVCDGVVSLGTWNGAGWSASGTRRNITITGNGSPTLDNIFPALRIGATPSPFINNLYDSLRVSGKIDLSGMTSSANFFMYMSGVSAVSTDGTAAGDSFLGPAAFGAANVVRLACCACSFGGKVTGNISLATIPAMQCTNFSGDVSIRVLAYATNCAFIGNVTANIAAAQGQGLLVACPVLVAKTWTITGGGSFWVDGSTYRWLRNAGAALGAATAWAVFDTAASSRLKFGGTLAVGNDRPAVNGTALTAAIAALNPSSQATADQDTFLSKLSWNTTTGTNATQVRVLVNGAAVVTTLLTGVKGTLAIQVSLAAGDLVSMDYTGTGPAPGASTFDLST
jgi:hypothetical protein